MGSRGGDRGATYHHASIKDTSHDGCTSASCLGKGDAAGV